MKSDGNVVNWDAERLKKIYLTVNCRELKVNGTEHSEITFLAAESTHRY